MSRLFFGFDIDAIWPSSLPRGRIIEAANRHFTLSFLGEQDVNKVLEDINSLPKISFSVAKTGYFDSVIFLSRVVAWHALLLEGEETVLQFQKLLDSWAQKYHHSREKDFCLHATLARGNFSRDEWKNNFSPSPFVIRSFQLYESLGDSNYRSLWQHGFLAPFEEIAHTADIAFKIRGENLNQIRANAFAALSFQYPALLAYFSKTCDCANLNDVIMHLNEVIGKADADQGVPFKAVSFHGELIVAGEGLLEWEMIVDV